MNKKGFTLVELLAVIIIISIVFSIGYVSLEELQKNIDESILASKYTSFEDAALNWGKDNLVIFESGTPQNITVESLISQNYLTATDVCSESTGDVECIKASDGSNLNSTIIVVKLDSGVLTATKQGS